MKLIERLFKSKNANTMALFNILGPVILNGINFFTVPIFTRLLGTANYGDVSIYHTWVQVLTILVGLQTGGTISVSMVHLGKEEHHKYCSSALFLSFCSFVFISLVALAFLPSIMAFTKMSRLTVILALLNGFGSFVISFATTKFTYDKEAYKTFFTSVIIALSGVALSMVLIGKIDVYEQKDMGRIIGSALPAILVGFVLLCSFLYKGKTFFNKKYWHFCLPICLPLIFHGLSQIVLSQSDRVMLQQSIDNSAVGIYSLIYSMAQILSIIWGALNNTWVPFYYDDVKAGKIDEIKRRSKNYLFLFTVLTVGFMCVSPEVVKVFASEDFWSGIPLLPILAVGMFFMFLYSFPVNFQFYNKRTSSIALGTTAAAVLNIILNALLIPAYGIAGAAGATSISYMALFIFHQTVSKNLATDTPYHYTVKDFAPYIGAVGLGVCGFYLLEGLWIVRWLIGAGLGIGLVAKTIKQRSIF